MAWNNIKITIPGVGERAYIFSNYIDNNGNCVPNTPNLRSCCYFANESWDVGQPLNGIYPSVGDWFTYTDTFSNAGQGQVACYKVLEIIDETMYNNGTCTVCPSTSPCGTNCVYTTAPYTPPPNGIAVTFWQTPVANANDFTAGITNNCSYCLLGQVVTPNTGNPPAWAECCGPHALLYAGRTTEVYPPTNIGGSWILPDNNVIPILPDDIGLPYCAFRGLNEPVSNGNLIVSPIDLWDDPQGWNQSTTIPSLTNWVDVHSFTNYISQAHPYYDKISNQPLNDFLDGIIILPITGHSSLTSVHPQPFQTNTYPVYQEDLRGDGCECSGESTTSVFTCPCLAQSPTYVSQADITTYGSVQNAINNLSGPTAYFNTHNISSFCVTNGCPDPNVAGNCLKVPLTARFSNFGDPNNATYGPLVWNGGGGWVSPYTTQNGTQVGYNYQQIIDWLNLVASTEGYVGGFTTSMTIAQLITLAQSQNTYTNQDYYDAQVNAGISTTVYPNVYPQDSVIPTPFVGAGASLCTGSQTTTTTTPETADVMFLGGFELIEKYITSPVSNYGTRMTNVLASGSWDNIRNFLYSAGMPNTYLSYDDARPWFESNANSAAMGLQTVVNPQAYPDNAPNRVNIFNDVYVINKSLTTRCPNGLPIGCTDQTATNYDPNALVNCDGSVLGSIQPGWNSCCNYIGQGCGAAVCWDCDLVTYSCYISSTGPYSSLQQCATACTDCSCVKVIGTGHTGGYYYTAQTNCDEDCCGGPSVGLCDVLIVGDDVGVLHYDPATHSTTHLFSDNSYDRYDIAASYDKIWIYTITGGGTKIKEFDITLSPFTLSYSRTITVPAYGIGKGLTFYGLNKLVCANTKVEVVDITPNAGQIGTISTLFSLPGGTSCTGDLVYTGTMGGVGSMFVILYGTANVKKVGKFTPTGVLIQDAVIPSTILTGTTFMDSLFTDVDTNTIYGITDDARVYELQQTPVLQFAPISTPMNSPIPLPGLVAGTGKIHGADNIQAPNNMAIELSCSSGITIPVSYNCSVAGTSIGCVDPGDGTGDYTGTTALFDCQNQTPGAGGCIVTWNCDPGNPGTECANVTVNLPWPSVWNKNSALAYIAHPGMGLQYTSLDQISYAGGSPQPGQCFIQTSSGSKPQWRVSYFQVSVVSNQNMYHWAYFINQCVLQGVPVNLSMTLQTVINKIALFYNIPSVSVMKIWTSPCICTAQPCDCFPVLGSSGQYPTEALCQIPCCGPDPCIKCCINKQGHQIQMSPNANPCKCPFGWVEIPCGPQGPCHPNVSCAPGYHWSYVHCRCVCDQQPCPWNWTWDDVTCNCVPNIMASKIPSDKYRDPKGTDITLARGVYDFEVSALTTTNTSFSTGGGVTTTGGGVGSGTGSGQDRFKLTETGCLMCERNQSEDYYKANNCIYTNSQCGEESVLTYYICSSATNPVVGESQKACIPQDIQPSSGVYYNNLESCLNSGCGGYMWCEAGQIVNGVNFEGYETQAYSPIPMCCSSMIQNTPQGKHVYSYTSSGPLTVSSCQSGCKDAPGDTWFPLYNAFGTNTFSESPLAYLTRELLLQVNVGQCIASTSDDKFVRLGYTKINPY